jgi:25S rRNA (cytosine2870-C5)-methyltransferase
LGVENKRAKIFGGMKAEIDVSHIEATYNDFLLEKIRELFSREEAAAFLVESDKQRPTTIRTNSLVGKRSALIAKLEARGVNMEALEWSDVGAVVYNTDVPVGATPEYLAGYYTVQGACSLLPVMALGPQEGERIADLCAAPGGKSTHIAAMMKNTGVLFANDVNKERSMALAASIQRMGVQNAVCTNMNGMVFPLKRMTRVLLDAPCTGTGVLSKDPLGKRSKDREGLERAQQRQMVLILKAFDMIDGRNPNATLVYSTCSILVEENEYVVDYLLRKRNNARVVDTGLAFGREGMKSFRGWHFDPSLSLTRRFYPHVHNIDGFFVAKIRKISEEQEKEKSEESVVEVMREERKKRKRVKKRGVKKVRGSRAEIENK